MTTKVCPQCGQVLFADMDTCYGCLHSFARTGRPAVGQAFAQPPRHEPAHLQGTVLRLWDEGALLDVDEPAGVAGPERDEGDAAPPDAEHARTAFGMVSGALSAGGDDAAARGELAEQEAMTRLADEGAIDMTTVVPAPACLHGLALRVQAPSLDMVVPLPDGGLSVGRAPDNDMVLHARSVSRRHMRIEPTHGGATLFDLGATNPALYRGHAISAEQDLAVGETVDVCGTLLTLVRADGAA